MDINQLRKRVRNLDSQRRKIQGQLLYPKEMIRGSLYELKRRCGNPRCRCARGEEHIGKYLSLPTEGKTKLTYVRRKDLEWVSEQAGSYRKYQKSLAEIRKINEEIFYVLTTMRKSKTKTYR